MQCQTFLQDLERFIENDFTDEEIALRKDHLTSCPSCETEYRAMVDLLNLLEREELPSPPDSFRNAVLRRLKGE